MKITTQLVEVEPVRRVMLELTEERAKALASAIDDGIVWSDTDVEDELVALYGALLGRTP